MFSTNTQDTTARTGTTDVDRRNTNTGVTTAPPSTHEQQPQQSNSNQQQGSSTLSTTMGLGSSSQPPERQQQQPTRSTGTTEPYQRDETTWWEEAHSPAHAGRAEQGYGPGPSGGRAGEGGGGGGGGGGDMTGGHQQPHDQQQYGQYGGRTRDDKRAHENQGVVNWNKVAKIICAILLPPLGVFLETGCDKNFAINLLLTILGYIPGIIHAIYVIFMD